MARQTKGFQQELDALCRSFKADESPGETNEHVLEALGEFILERERIRHKVAKGTEMARQLDQLTLRKMCMWDTDNPDHLLAEKMGRKLAQGDKKGALSLMRNMDDRARNRSEEAARRASASREPNPLDEEIRAIVAKNRKISGKLLIRELERQAGAGNGVIDFMDDDVIRLYDGREYKTSGVKNRLHRTKKEFPKS